MKRQIRTTLLVMLAGVFVVAACNKDQQVVRELEGDWTMSSYVVDGWQWLPMDSVNTTYSFTKCKVKDGPCSGSYTYQWTGSGPTTDVFNFNYSISDKGEKIDIDFTEDIIDDLMNMDIDSHTDTEFKFSGTDGSGFNIEATLTKL